MSSRAILIDCCLAVAVAVTLVIVAPGLGVVALIAIVSVVVCVASFGIEWVVRRWRRRTPRPLG